MDFRPTHYGMTGADETYIKEHGLVPNAAGEYPRLDTIHPPIPMIQLSDGQMVPTDMPDKLLEIHIADAMKVWKDLKNLYYHRRRVANESNAAIPSTDEFSRQS